MESLTSTKDCFIQKINDDDLYKILKEEVPSLVDKNWSIGPILDKLAVEQLVDKIQWLVEQILFKLFFMISFVSKF